MKRKIFVVEKFEETWKTKLFTIHEWRIPKKAIS